jgi:hypothetical protein
VTVVNERFNFRANEAIEIKAGETTSHTVTLPTSTLLVTTAPDAEIWIEGERVGTAPLSPVQVPIGTREVIVKHREYGEKRQAVEVVYGRPVEVSLRLDNNVASGPARPRLAPLSAPPGPRTAIR